MTEYAKELEADQPEEEQEIIELIKQVEDQGLEITGDQHSSQRVKTAPRVLIPHPNQIFLGTARRSQASRRGIPASQNSDLAHFQINQDYTIKQQTKNISQSRDKAMSSFSKRSRAKDQIPQLIKIQGEGREIGMLRMSLKSNESESYRTSLVSTPFQFSNRYPERAPHFVKSFQVETGNNQPSLFVKAAVNPQGLPKRQSIEQEKVANQSRMTFLGHSGFKTEISQRVKGRQLLQSEHGFRSTAQSKQTFFQSFDRVDKIIEQVEQQSNEPMSSLSINTSNFKHLSLKLYQPSQLESVKSSHPLRSSAAMRLHLLQQQQRNKASYAEQSDQKKKQLTIMAITMNQEIPLRVQQPKEVVLAKRKAAKVQNKFSAYKLDSFQHESNQTKFSQTKQRLKTQMPNLTSDQRAEIEARTDVIKLYLQRVKAIQLQLDTSLSGQMKSPAKSKLDTVKTKRQENRSLPKVQQSRTPDDHITDVDLLMQMSQFIQRK